MTKRTSASPQSARSRLHGVLLVLGIVLLAANLRPALTGVKVPLALLLAITVCLLIAGLGAARDARVGEPGPDEAG